MTSQVSCGESAKDAGGDFQKRIPLTAESVASVSIQMSLLTRLSAQGVLHIVLEITHHTRLVQTVDTPNPHHALVSEKDHTLVFQQRRSRPVVLEGQI